MLFKLTGVFAANTAVKEDDVRLMKRILNRLGYYMPSKSNGSTHIPDRALFEGLKDFQADHSLRPTGAAKPGDATIAALNVAMEEQAVLDESYIWCTRKDDSVRPGHAEREGRIFSWGNPPDGGHPGEDQGCRCWAKPTNEKNISKPDCHEKELSFMTAKNKCDSLNQRKNKIFEDLKVAVAENNRIVKEMQGSLGKQIATLIIGWPIERLKFVGELLQRVIGEVASNKILDIADRLGKELFIIRNKIEYLKAQIAIIDAELKNAEDARNKAAAELEKCKGK